MLAGVITAAPDRNAPRPPTTTGVDSCGISCKVRAALRAAILDARKDDRDLFRNQTHERAIMFHVGRRLAKAVGKWPGGWSVDLEYNRAGQE